MDMSHDTDRTASPANASTPVDATKPARPTEPGVTTEPSESFYHGPRGLAVKILSRVERSDSYLDKLIDYTLRTEELDERDRRLLIELSYGVLRNREKLDWVLTGFYHGEFPKCLTAVKNAMRVALYQILFLDKIPWSAAVNESVDIVKRLKGGRSAGIVNGVLRNIIRKINAITWPVRDANPLHYFSVVHSHPQWMVRRWLDRFGPRETEQLLIANNNRPPVTISVDTTRCSIDQIRKTLADNGSQSEYSPLLPSYLRVKRIGDLSGFPEFQQGLFTVQDDAAGLAARLTGVRPGMRVIDLCAAPGGKSIAMAEMMKGEGRIIALDKYEAKLELLRNAINRSAHEEIISPMIGDASSITLEAADVVLLDAPCSGLGVLRRKPEIKWKREANDIVALAALQLELLTNASRMVVPGGVLVYTTCTTEPEENAQVVASFLAAHPEFTLESAEAYLPDSALRAGVVTAEGYLEVLPHRHGSDGAFGARLKRTG